MPIKPRDLETKLKNKFKFSQSMGDHRFCELKLDGLPTIRTKVSHSREEIGKAIESRIVKQLHVKKIFFHEMINCTKKRQDYINILKTAPYPLF